MAQKTVGYVELEWTCANCGNKNPGSRKVCSACGAPQPENVQFEQAGQASLISDEQKIVAAKKGADIQCPYCGTRNAGDAALCVQCGGDLKEGTRRTSGKVVGAFQGSNEPGRELACPACGKSNPATAKNCLSCGAPLAGRPESVPPQAAVSAGAAGTASGGIQSNIRPWMVLPVIAILLTCCLVVGYFLNRTETRIGTVQSVGWTRTISIEALQDVSHHDWADQIPSDGNVKSCEQRLYETKDSPVSGAREVCGTPYTVDTGNGFGEVKQDCVYEVYKDYCEYTVKEWGEVDQQTLQGSDMNPVWPQISLSQGQREGAKTAKYAILFETADGVKEFTTDSEELFRQLQPGTQWTLIINTFGAVVSVEP